MSSWFDRQVDRWVDEQVNKAVDDQVDKFLEPYIGKDDLRRVKKLTAAGRPLDAETEAMLRKHLTQEQLEDYRKIHNSVAAAERLDSDLGVIDDLLG